VKSQQQPTSERGSHDRKTKRYSANAMCFLHSQAFEERRKKEVVDRNGHEIRKDM
jgi:hypothetical protein